MVAHENTGDRAKFFNQTRCLFRILYTTITEVPANGHPAEISLSTSNKYDKLSCIKYQLRPK